MAAEPQSRISDLPSEVVSQVDELRHHPQISPFADDPHDDVQTDHSLWLALTEHLATFAPLARAGTSYALLDLRHPMQPLLIRIRAARGLLNGFPDASEQSLRPLRDAIKELASQHMSPDSTLEERTQYAKLLHGFRRESFSGFFFSREDEACIDRIRNSLSRCDLQPKEQHQIAFSLSIQIAAMRLHDPLAERIAGMIADRMQRGDMQLWACRQIFHLPPPRNVIGGQECRYVRLHGAATKVTT